jgi:23S rRNA pseudouridine1911/1915/1917 synthase
MSRQPPVVLLVEAVHAGLRADAYLALKLPAVSRSRLKHKIMTGEALVNGHRLATSTRLRAGDRLAVSWSEDPSPPTGLEVLYEDDHLLAVNKPAGVPIHPAGRRQRGTIIQSVRQAFRDQIQRSLEAGDPGFYPSLVHRLDLFSSGVVLIAKDRSTLVAMHRKIATGGVSKRYLALVVGHVTPARGRIEAAIGRDESSPIGVKRCVRPDGLPAVTEYEVLESFREHTLLAVFPLTGRQHQIRVHLAWRGHPLWGDLIYLDESLFLRYAANGCKLDPTLPPRHGLHAECVRFRHPAGGRELELAAPLAEDLASVIAELRLPASPGGDLWAATAAEKKTPPGQRPAGLSSA